MTDRIDELQRLHEAATKGPWIYDRCKRKTGRGGYSVLGPDGSRIFWENYNGDADIEGDDDDVGLVLAMRNALPALLRLARAAKEIAGNVPLDIDQRIRWLEVQVGREEWAELLAALAELESRPGDVPTNA